MILSRPLHETIVLHTICVTRHVPPATTACTGHYAWNLHEQPRLLRKKAGGGWRSWLIADTVSQAANTFHFTSLHGVLITSDGVKQSFERQVLSETRTRRGRRERRKGWTVAATPLAPYCINFQVQTMVNALSLSFPFSFGDFLSF